MKKWNKTKPQTNKQTKKDPNEPNHKTTAKNQTQTHHHWKQTNPQLFVSPYAVGDQECWIAAACWDLSC